LRNSRVQFLCDWKNQLKIEKRSEIHDQGQLFMRRNEYEVEPIPEKVYNCHCFQCRKSHGAAFATQALV
jgi:hypothetical protein